jgi:iron only hydrogenase large subunit-like protein/uncharacterized Fe-S cluster-containing protein
MKDGQAQVVEERCLFCGTCVRECPQNAKVIRDDTTWAAQLLASGKKIAASVAPTYPAAFGEHEIPRLASALRKLGFSYVAETSVGADAVARATSQWLAEKHDGPTLVVTSACPTVVRYVELYAPHSVDVLVPIVSPMIAHGRHLRNEVGADAVVFIGPCVAKKFEAQRAVHQGLVDCVLTFGELRAWFEREGLRFDQLEESRFDEEGSSRGRLFPVAGGHLHASDLPTDLLTPEVFSISGVQPLQECLAAPMPQRLTVVEPLFCNGGCIGGPGITDEESVFQRRLRVLSHARQSNGPSRSPSTPPLPDWKPWLLTSYTPHAVDGTVPTEDAIRRALARIGKIDPRDQLDCGACGYRSCREKALAVVRGLAEPEMCMPRMRLLAERRVDRIMETSPNGIVILDNELRIIAMNPAFEKMFLCSNVILGRHISYLTDATPFEQVLAGRAARVERTAPEPRYGRIFHQIVYALEQDEQIVGIFVDVTESNLNRERLATIHREALERSRQLLEHQVRMAQDITRLLAEHTAHGEELVKNLLEAALVEPHAIDLQPSAMHANHAKPLR